MAGEHDPIEPAPAPAPAPDAQQAMDRLNEQNRILTETRMLPRSKPLTPKQTADVIAFFNSYVERTKTTQAQVSREIGYSQAVVSAWISGNYKGDSDKVTHAINDWMERDSRRQSAKRPQDYISTRIADSIRTLVSVADKRCLIGVIVTPSGSGKTKVLKVLTEQMRGVYLYCDQQLTVREFLRSLAQAMGKTFHGGTKAEIQRWIIGALTNTHRILFLDEAHQLGAALNCIRSIYDQAGVPIILAGTADIMQHVNDRADGRGQFASRCVFYNAMEGALNVEGPGSENAGARDLFTLEEIKAFFEMKKIRLADDALDLCWSLACLPNHGTLRLIERTVDTALDIYPELEIVTRRHVLLALKLTVGEASMRHLEKVAVRHQELSKAVA